MKTWRHRFSAGAMGAFFVSVMGIWFLLSAVEWQWFTREGLAFWYSWPAALVPPSLQNAGAGLICSLSLGEACVPVAAPAQYAGLQCWAGSAATWCADLPYATATLVWCLLGIVAFALSRLLWPTLGALPPEAGLRARRQHAWFQIGLEAVMVVWMGWAVYDLVRNPAGSEADCTGAAAACIYDVADRLPSVPFYALMVLFGLFSMIEMGVRHRREIFTRTEPISKSV